MDMATHEDTLPAPIGPEAEAEAARIADDRKLLAAEEANERELIELRKSRLADADDAEIDDIELKIGASRSKQLRIIERIEVRSQRLIDANAKVRQSLIDDLITRGEAARELGEKVLRTEYAKAAEKASAAITKLAAISRYIERINYFLSRRQPGTHVGSPNAIRCRPVHRYEETVKRTVDWGDPRHPAYGKVHFTLNGRPCTQGGVLVEPIEIEETVTRTIDSYIPGLIEEEAVLPGLQQHADYWNTSHLRRVQDEELTEHLAAIGFDLTFPEID
jgi:hypothetical protein